MNWIIIWWLLNGGFKCSIILSILVGILLQGRLYLFHVYVCKRMWTHELLFYSMKHNPLFSLFILILTFSSSANPCFLLTCLYYSLSTLLLSGITHFPRLILSCSFSVLDLQVYVASIQESLLLFSGDWYLEAKIWVLDVLIIITVLFF